MFRKSLVLLLILASAVLPAVADCGAGALVAHSVPQSLWTAELHPADDPDRPFPGDRDSTGYVTTTVPSCISGHELFKDVEVLADYAFVAYNAGVQVWRIGQGAEARPQKMAFADGFYGCQPGQAGACCGQPFQTFIRPGELDTAVDEVAVAAAGPDVTLIGLSGIHGVGFSAWSWSPGAGGLRQIYQDSSRDSWAVDVVNVGTVYGISASGAGVDVYDISRAMSCPGASCDGVRLGTVGTMGSWVSVAQSPAGRVLVAIAGGTSQDPHLELWDLEPARPQVAKRLVSAPRALYHAPVLFELAGDDLYLAAVQRAGLDTRLVIWDVGACLAGCSELPEPVYTRELLPIGTRQKLTFSRSGVTPFLYYGLPSVKLQGGTVDGLLDLSGLADGRVVEVTAGGPSYLDDCSGESVSYWSWYYPGNESGLNQYSPLAGVFRGRYFYRTANSILDIHVWSPPPALIFADGFESGDLDAW